MKMHKNIIKLIMFLKKKTKLFGRIIYYCFLEKCEVFN